MADFLWRRKDSDVSAVYIANLFVSFHYFLIIYINSSFLSQYLSDSGISILYIIGSLISLLFFAYFSRILKRIGNYRLISFFILLEALSLVGLAFAHGSMAVLFFFTVFLAISPVIYLNLDIFLEKFIKDERVTGGMRGLFLTMINIAQVVCPLIAGLLLDSTDAFWKVYLVSVAFLLIGLAVIVSRLRTFHDASYNHRSLRESLAYVFKRPNLYNVFAAQFLLRFFYAWMVIYTPLYLFRYVGFTWAQIGIMFAIMLLPFLLLELPLGRIADMRYDEKEIMIVGFVLMALMVALMPFLTTPVFLFWTVVLFVSRVGASCTEIATESYFFKHVDSSFSDTISLFRVARPATYVAAAVVASISLQLFSLQWSFLVLAVVMALGLKYSFALQDIR